MNNNNNKSHFLSNYVKLRVAVSDNDDDDDSMNI